MKKLLVILFCFSSIVCQAQEKKFLLKDGLMQTMRTYDSAAVKGLIDAKAAKITTLTINGTTQDLSTNRTWTIPGTDTTSLSNRINAKENVLTFSGPLSRSTNAISIPAASSISNGYLSAADWVTFNNKQAALTNPVTGTGTAGYLSKFSGTTALGSSLIYETGSRLGLGTITPSEKFDFKGGNLKLDSAIKWKDTTTGSTGRYNWEYQPKNYGTVYPGYGKAMGFSGGYDLINGVNGSGRPNVVWTMLGYNHNLGGGRIDTAEASLGFRVETHYEVGGQVFEVHWPELQTKSGFITRPFSQYLNKTTGVTSTNLQIDGFNISDRATGSAMLGVTNGGITSSSSSTSPTYYFERASNEKIAWNMSGGYLFNYVTGTFNGSATRGWYHTSDTAVAGNNAVHVFNTNSSTANLFAVTKSGTDKFYMANNGNATFANNLSVTGSLTATTGTIAGVLIGPDGSLKRFYSDNAFEYQSNAGGNITQHLFTNQIGAGFGGSSAAVVKISSGDATATGTAILRLLGSSSGEKFTFLANGTAGFGTTSPVSTLDVAGSVGSAITTISTNTTLDATHSTVIVTSGTPVITLPAASTATRREYVLVNQTGSSVTTSSYLDFAGSSVTTFAANSSITVKSNGTSWYRVR